MLVRPVEMICYHIISWMSYETLKLLHITPNLKKLLVIQVTKRLTNVGQDLDVGLVGRCFWSPCYFWAIEIGLVD